MRDGLPADLFYKIFDYTHPTDQIDRDLDHLDTNLPLLDVVQDL